MNYYEALEVQRTAPKSKIFEAIEEVQQELDSPSYANKREYSSISQEQLT